LSLETLPLSQAQEFEGTSIINFAKLRTLGKYSFCVKKMSLQMSLYLFDDHNYVTP